MTNPLCRAPALCSRSLWR